ncbi:hypothetical protein V6N12_051325 [Hibiscus sabdariffa]|uniref:Zinc finger-XS domain-containing protein n=1 Tax=Hibiscus sabdariffa TaxID=183260 RepID=A0ABR2GF03_9ROSI
MASGKFFKGNPRIKVEAVVQDPGVLKIPILSHGVGACEEMQDQEEEPGMLGADQSWANQSNDSRMATGRGNPRPQMVNNNNAKVEEDNDGDDIDDDSVGDDAFDDSDDELLTDEIDSDSSQKSHETRKKNRWFKKLFETLDRLSIEEINDPEKRWHCPACQGAPGATDWLWFRV